VNKASTKSLAAASVSLLGFGPSCGGAVRRTPLVGEAAVARLVIERQAQPKNVAFSASANLERQRQILRSFMRV